MSETLSSGVATFLDGYKDLLFGMRWLLVPAILVTMALVIANSISISVRERRVEMAVLKVLKGIERIVDLIERAILIQAAKGVLGHWRFGSGGASRPPRRRNHQSASRRVDASWCALAGSNES